MVAKTDSQDDGSARRLCPWRASLRALSSSSVSCSFLLANVIPCIASSLRREPSASSLSCSLAVEAVPRAVIKSPRFCLFRQARCLCLFVSYCRELSTSPYRLVPWLARYLPNSSRAVSASVLCLVKSPKKRSFFSIPHRALHGAPMPSSSGPSRLAFFFFG